MRSWFLAVALASVGSVACSDDNSGDSRGGVTGSGDCTLSDLCAKLTVSQVAAACGSTATTSSPFDFPDPQADLRGCHYEGPDGEVFFAQIACFHDGAGTAQLAFTEEHDQPPVLETTQEDLTGVGDRAFFRYSLLTGEAEIWAQRGRLIGSLLDFEPNDAAATKQCMTTLVAGLLAAN